MCKICRIHFLQLGSLPDVSITFSIQFVVLTDNGYTFAYFVLKVIYCVMWPLTSKVAQSGLYLYCVVHSIILQNMFCNLFLVFLLLKSHKINIHTHITCIHTAVHICFVIHSVAVIKQQ